MPPDTEPQGKTGNWRNLAAPIAKISAAPFDITSPAELGFVINPREKTITVRHLRLRILSGAKTVYLSGDRTLSRQLPLSGTGQLGYEYVLDKKSLTAAAPFFKAGNDVEVEVDAGPAPGQIDGFFIKANM